MAGRGRGAVLPAWMTANDNSLSTNGNNGATADVQAVPYGYEAPEPAYSEYPRQPIVDYSRPTFESKRDSRDRGDRGDRGERSDRDRERERHREREHERDHGRRRDSRDRDNGRDKRSRRSRERGRSRDKRREREPSPEERVWKPRVGTRPSNWDLCPPEGVVLPPIGVSNTANGVPNAFLSFSNNPLALMKQPTLGATGASVVDNLTRHARRVYAGGIPPTVREYEISNFFNDVVSRAVPRGYLSSAPVHKVNLNLEKCYAFVEMTTVELATACMQLDGIRFPHQGTSVILRIRRPTDYRPDLVQYSGPIPDLDMEYLATLGVSVPGGPGKIFVGGLPYNLDDEQIIELLEAFGKLKYFHQVRDPTTGTSKGYGFCEYSTSDTADAAIGGLNGMPLGDKILTVKYAAQVTTPGINPPPSSAVQTLQAVSYNLANSYPTRVLKLSNMVTHEDLIHDEEYMDILEDVRLECLGHGQVLNVVIPRIKDGFAPLSEGYIYVEFAYPDHAKSAALALNGRRFAENVVVVEYFDESRFANRAF